MSDKINSWDGLKQLRSRIQSEADAAKNQTVIAVGMATCGVAAGANDIMAALKDEISKSGIKDVALVPTGCYGFCYAEPMVEVRSPKGSFKYGPVDDALARDIINKHIAGGEVIEKAIIKQEVERA